MLTVFKLEPTIQRPMTDKKKEFRAPESQQSAKQHCFCLRFSGTGDATTLATISPLNGLDSIVV